jgi:hypothetical protein
LPQYTESFTTAVTSWFFCSVIFLAVFLSAFSLSSLSFSVLLVSLGKVLVSIQILNRLPSIIFLQWVVFPDHQVMINFSAFVWTCKRCVEFSGQLFLLERTPQQWQPSRTGWWVSSQPFEFLTKATRVSGPWFASTPSLPCSSCPSSVENFVFLRRIRDHYRVNCRCLLHPHFRTHVQVNVCSLGDRVQHSSFCGF